MDHLPEKDERKEDLMEKTEADRSDIKAALRPDFSQVS